MRKTIPFFPLLFPPADPPDPIHTLPLPIIKGFFPNSYPAKSQIPNNRHHTRPPPPPPPQQLPHHSVHSLFSCYNSPRKVTSETLTSCSDPTPSATAVKIPPGTQAPLTNCSGVGGDGTIPLRGLGAILLCLCRDLWHAWLPGPRDPAVLHGRRAPRLREGGRYVSYPLG